MVQGVQQGPVLVETFFTGCQDSHRDNFRRFPVPLHCMHHCAWLNELCVRHPCHLRRRGRGRWAHT